MRGLSAIRRPAWLAWATLQRVALFYAVWLVLSGGRGDFLLLGLPACLLAAAVSGAIRRRSGKRVRLVALLTYMPGFFWRSLCGGLDIAWRVVHPRLPVAPAFVRYACREEDEDARVWFCDALSLMPGTLAAGIEGREALVHLLAEDEAMAGKIATEERRIRRVFDDHPGMPGRMT